MKNNPDLLLLFPSFGNDETFYQLKFDWNIGASYIIAYLKAKGIYALQFIQREPIDMDTLIKKVLVYASPMIGFTCNDVNYFFIKLISKELKKRRKDITIVVGGPTATFLDELILKNEETIDICVRGEGEETAIELINYLKGKININQIKGISYRAKGKIRRNPDRIPLRGKEKGKELDIFPSPYLTDVLPPDGSIGISTSRGCFYHCIYCSFSAISRWRVSYHSVERVLSELKMISAACSKDLSQAPIVYFYDDTFSLDLHRAKMICRSIIDENTPLSFWCTTRADHLDDELLKLMKKANFRAVHLGLESAVPENLRTINKVSYKANTNKDLSKEINFINKVKESVETAHSLDLNVTVSIIAGLPKQTKRQVEATLDFVKNLKPKVYYHDNLTIYPGTSLFNKRKEFGLNIISSKTKLPYKPRFPFDVTKVKMLPNAAQKYSIVEILTNIATSFFTRKKLLFPNSVGIPALFFKNYMSDLCAFIEKNGIKKSITLSPILFLFQKNRKNIKKDLDKLIENYIPVINLLSLRNFNAHKHHKDKLCNEQELYELVFLTEVTEKRRLGFQKLALFLFLSVSKLYQKAITTRIENKDYDRKVILLTLNNQEDKINFKKLLLDPAPLKNFLKYEEADCYMINQCQWINRLCPIIQEKNLFISQEGENTFCYNGRTINGDKKKVFTNISYLKSNLENRLKEMEKRRGCGSCKLNKSCSKCMFTFPFSEKEFCDIRRSGNVKRLVSILDNYNRLNGLVRIKRMGF